MGLKISMLGIMGAGKGTQAAKLSDYLGIPHISTGDIFREAVKKKTELGIKAEKIMKKGSLVPDDIVLGIIRERLEQPDMKQGYILDGFPRTLNQAKEFEKINGFDIVFYIDIPQHEAVKRLKGRRICRKCKKQYNIYLDKNIGQKCKRCGGDLTRREDDKKEVVRKRIENYINQTEPLIKYYNKKNILKEIDGNQEIDKVFETIKESVKKNSSLK